MPEHIQQSGYRTIAFVSNNAWSVYNFRLDVIRSLLASGYRVVVLSPHDAYAARLEKEGCAYIPVTFNNRAASPFHDLRFYRSISRLYRQLKPDFIFHYVAKPNIYGSLAASEAGIPSVAVITGLGYPFAKRNWLFNVMRILYTRALRQVSEVWFLNNDDAGVFVREKITSVSKIKVLPGEGVDTDHFRPAGFSNRDHRNTFTFLMSSRLLKSKGVGVYADAARILRKKNLAVQCVLIGFFEDGHPDSISRDELGKWQAEGLLRYDGFTDDVRPWLAKADCFVFPSFYHEGVPRCLMEAASMEIPIITAQNRGSKEVVMHNTNGYICQPNDPFDLARKMEDMMLLDGDARAAMGRSGRRLVLEKFDVSKIIGEYANTLISAFERKHGSNSYYCGATEDNRR